MKKIIIPFLLLFVSTFVSCLDIGGELPPPPISSAVVVFPFDNDNAQLTQQQEDMVNALIQSRIALYFVRTIDGDGAKQATEINNLIATGVVPPFMIIMTTDAYSVDVSAALKKYKSMGGKILAYDRLPQNSTDIDGFISASYQKIGNLQSQALDGLADGSRVEILSGPQYDNNAKTLFDGAYESIGKKISQGKLLCPSGKSTYEDTKVKSWGKEDAFVAMRDILKAHYKSPDMPAAVLAGSDAQAAGVVLALQEHYPQITQYPIITGMNNTEKALARLVLGTQTMTVDCGTSELVSESVKVILAWATKQSYDFPSTVITPVATVPYKNITSIKAIYKKDLK
ncbi:MAG: substrate-binding domain-containing protein [Mucinivorans sp.]